ncbi:MAG TPA: GNAT family N-acetyltransferase [Verrucomicrobiota bacterium]|nr:GNAT family N-acetyltransferase [Verrucomicrobiota bacterium]HNT13441.1 GNAT family N-acetyltransferase [Verrucomicrobiota bacterium]
MAEPSATTVVHEWLGEHRLADGRKVRFRHLRPSDEPLITAAINSASAETLLHRFFSPVRQVSPEMLRRMLRLEGGRETCIVGLVETPAGLRLICGARYVKLSTPEAAEVAITVHDDFHRVGLGHHLLRLLARLAVRDGVRVFTAEVLSSNEKMLHLLRKVSGGRIQGKWTGEVYHAEIPLPRLLS